MRDVRDFCSALFSIAIRLRLDFFGVKRDASLSPSPTLSPGPKERRSEDRFFVLVCIAGRLTIDSAEKAISYLDAHALDRTNDNQGSKTSYRCALLVPARILRPFHRQVSLHRDRLSEVYVLRRMISSLSRTVGGGNVLRKD